MTRGVFRLADQAALDALLRRNNSRLVRLEPKAARRDVRVAQPANARSQRDPSQPATGKKA